MGPQEHDEDVAERDFWDSLRLAVVFSAVAGLAALVLAGRIPDTTIIATIIVLGTALSWFRLEAGHRRTATVRVHRGPRRR